MKATRHAVDIMLFFDWIFIVVVQKFSQPQDDYEDKEKNFGDEATGDVDGEESSDLDEDEFDDDGLDCESAVEIDDE